MILMLISFLIVFPYLPSHVLPHTIVSIVCNSILLYLEAVPKDDSYCT